MNKAKILNKKNKIHVKQGDHVKIISGAHKGETGIIIQVLQKKRQVIIKDINLKTKHNKPKQEGESGKITMIESPIDSSNVMLYDKTKKIAGRYKITTNQEGNKIRIIKKVEQILKNNE